MKTPTESEWQVADTDHGPRTTDHGPQTALHAARPTLHTRHLRQPSTVTPHPPRAAFTLVEMLIVISIMAILATLMFPALRAVKQNQIRTRARGELIQLETALHAYQSKFGHYPPDTGTNYLYNRASQLYYELLGTTNDSGIYRTLDGSAQISADPSVIGSACGPNVSGFINCSRPGGGDEAPTGVTFLKGLKPSQYTATTINGVNCTVLGTTVEGPLMWTGTDGRKINPWRYNSSSPRYNPKSFDLWIDVMVGGKTNRISNWSEKPLVVGAPY